MKNNKRKPKNLIKRKYKEGSMYEEEWLVDSINRIIYDFEKDKKYQHLLSLLLILNLGKEYQNLLNTLKDYNSLVFKRKGIFKTL